MPSNESDKLPHFLISDTAHSEPYTPISSRGKTFRLPPRHRQSHGQKLLRQFDRIREESRTIISEQRAFGIDAGNGIYIQFESEPDFELKFESLEATRSGIELLAVREVENKIFATVFVPEGKIDILTKKIADYLEKDTSPTSEKAKHKQLVESISEIKKAAIEALWTDELEVFPTEDLQEIWWEVWLRVGDDPQSIIDFFKEHAQNIGFTVYPKEIRFPDRSVVAVYGTKEQMSRSVRRFIWMN